MFIYMQERWILGAHGDMCTDEVKAGLLRVEHLLKRTQQDRISSDMMLLLLLSCREMLGCFY